MKINKKGQTTLAVIPSMFAISEVLFHANPVVGGIVAGLGAMVVYRHFDDGVAKVEVLKEELIEGYTRVQPTLSKVGNGMRVGTHTHTHTQHEHQRDLSTEEIDIADNLKIHADTIIGNRTLVVGIPGSGKTSLGANIIHALGDLDIPFLIPDFKQDYLTLADTLPNCLVGGPDDVSVENAANIASAMYDEKLKLIINFPLFATLEDAMDICIAIIDELFKLSRRLPPEDRQPVCIVLDEAQAFFPEKGSSILAKGTYEKALKSYASVVSMGRSLGLFPVIMTQRFAQTNKQVIALRDVCFLMAQKSKQDIDAYNDIVDVSKFSFASFNSGDCVYVDPSSRTTKIRCHKRRSEDRSFTPKLAQNRRRERERGVQDDSVDTLEETSLEEIPIKGPMPTIPDKGLKAEDVPLDTLINVWNCSKEFQSVRGLMLAFGFTNHQAQKAYHRIREQFPSMSEE